MEYVLLLVVGGILILSILNGCRKGLFRTLLHMVALILTIVLVMTFSPTVSQVLKSTTPIYEKASESIYKTIQETLELDGDETEEEQEQALENSFLPEVLKKTLLDHNNEDIYQTLGVSTFLQYISNYLAGIVVNAFAFILTFLLIFIAIRFIIFILDVVGRIPGIHAVNKIGGGFLGFLQGLVFLWVLCFVVTLLTPTAFGQELLTAIEANRFLSMIYNGSLSASSVLKLGKYFL